MNKSAVAAMAFVVLILIGLKIGGLVAECVFSGIATLMGFYFLMEFIRPLKWLIYHYGRLVDFCLFIFTIWLTYQRGVTIAMAMVIFGVGYTTILVPYVKKTYYLQNK